MTSKTVSTKTTKLTETLVDLENDENSISLDNFKQMNEMELYEVIIDFALSLSDRLKAFYLYNEKYQENMLDFISKIISMYNFSGSSLLGEFIFKCCFLDYLNPVYKIECIKGLITYKEKEYDTSTIVTTSSSSSTVDIDKQIENINEQNLQIRERNRLRIEKAYDALDKLCNEIYTNNSDNYIPTPSKIQLVTILMGCDRYRENAYVYFTDIVCYTKKLDCVYRYKSILSLEKKTVLTIDFTSKPKPIDYWYFIGRTLNVFVFDTENDIYYRILAGQYLLELLKNDCSDCISVSAEKSTDISTVIPETSYMYANVNQYLDREQIENCIYDICSDSSNEYNRRADAADVLIKLGSESAKEKAKEIIRELGNVDCQTVARTVFENAQNVHTEAVEESTNEILEFLATYSKKENINEDPGEPISIVSIHTILNEYIKENADKYTEEKIGKSTEQLLTNIKISLNRIGLDRTLYSKYNLSLQRILFKIWEYLDEHESRLDMINRLIEELDEMSDTCSSGYATRFANIISGFGTHKVRISWEDQIVSNFCGRLNARARKISSNDSIFRTDEKLLYSIIELWLKNNKEGKELSREYNQMAVLYSRYTKLSQHNLFINSTITNEDGAPILPTHMNRPEETSIDNKKNFLKITEEMVKQIIDEYLNVENRDELITKQLENFEENVINEMANRSSDWSSRVYFSFFFRIFAPKIREEMYEEFREYISDASFDLYFRKALMAYDGL